MLNSPPIKVFWLERTDRARRAYRCYQSEPPCAKGGYCNAHRPLDTVPVTFDADGCMRELWRPEDFPAEAFPTQCEACGRPFTAPQRQIFTEVLYRAPDGQEHTLRDAPPGAMWDTEYMKGRDGKDWGYTGPDGIALTVKCPDGHTWLVDSEASNCDRKQWVPDPTPEHPGARRFVRTHYCWVRHGDPRTGNVHVDKAGNTCHAGAGSILTPNWHGFLHNGQLVTC